MLNRLHGSADNEPYTLAVWSWCATHAVGVVVTCGGDPMEPARQDDRRSNSDGELESILREVEASRRRPSAPADRPAPEPHPGSGGVVIETPATKPPTVKQPLPA